jgi:hypothetical protein
MRITTALTHTPAILRARTFACALAVTAAFGAAATPASAQFGGRASFGEAFQPDILQRDMMLMTSSLQLEEWQRPIVEALLSDYMVSFNTGVEALKDKMKAASQEAARSTPADGDAILEKVMKPLDAWRVEKAQMKDKFLSDLRNQLGPQQLERWPSFERALRRERMLPAGDLSGESVDLWAVMGRMQLSSAEEEATRAAVTAYEIALDQALVAREARIKELEPALAEAMRAMNFDRGADLQDQVMTARIAVRAANDGGIDSLAQALGARGAEFRQRALEAGYPDVYRTHPVMVLMQQARALDSLTEDQVSKIDALMAEFRTACEAEDAKLYDAVRAEEPKAPRKRAQAAAERRAGGASSAPGAPQSSNANDPVVKARMEREKMGQPFRDRLMAILSTEQQTELPGGMKVDSETLAKEREAARKSGLLQPDDKLIQQAPAQKDRKERGPQRRDPRTGGAPAVPPETGSGSAQKPD